MQVFALERPELPPLVMPARFRREIAYFMTPSGEQGAPPLAEGEYWVRLEDSRRWLEEGVLHLVSPLNSENRAEVELSEDQETWLEWMVAHGIQHLRLVS